MTKITSKWCRICECFATHKDEKCLKCLYDINLKKDESIARKEKITYRPFTEQEGKVLDSFKAKKGRGRPKGSKNK